ncbi:MAG: DUF3386 family protein [Planctomycetia bacterium]|nr:DUF3386 family protein [Planctomycetia bacterium]
MKRQCIALLALLLLGPLSWGHFVWVVPNEQFTEAQVIFSDSLEPDDAKLLAKIAKTDLFLRQGDKAPTAVKWTLGKDAYLVKVEDKAATALSAICDYGVIQKGNAEPFQLKYNATTTLARTPDYKLKPFDKLDLEVQPVADASGVIAVKVLWRGKPLEGAEVVGIGEGLEKTPDVKTDKNGEIRLGKAGTLSQPGGKFGVRAKHVEAKEGEADGKKFKETRYYSTLVLTGAPAKKVSADTPADAKENPDASKLLKDARNARAIWTNFPGFTADIAVNVDGVVQKGTLQVSAKGEVQIEKLDKAAETWARRNLASTVMHRLDNSGAKDTPCAFLDKNTDHPLGQAIRVLNDELHSSYRIKDKQILEVNRVMEGRRFSISVLENKPNEEGKFLSVAFVVNYWNLETGELARSEANHQTWKRVGGFDLPVTTTVVTSFKPEKTGKGSTAQSLTLSNHKLVTAVPK